MDNIKYSKIVYIKCLKENDHHLSPGIGGYLKLLGDGSCNPYVIDEKGDIRSGFFWGRTKKGEYELMPEGFDPLIFKEQIINQYEIY